MATIYEDIAAAGIPIDHHESDLYFLATPEAREIMRKHKMVNLTARHRQGTAKDSDKLDLARRIANRPRNKSNGMSFEFFVSDTDNQVWVDVPFGYDPWWQETIFVSRRGNA